jgi:hypothetical protein
MNEFYLNTISEAEVGLEVAKHGMVAIEEFVFWLQLQAKEVSGWQDTFSRNVARTGFNRSLAGPLRMAPSLICKGEVELFGRSMPRFAFRLQPVVGGFLNVRRLATLAGQLYADKMVPREVIELVLNAPCIADAFLKPPQRHSIDDWCYLSAPLSKACGEGDHSNEDTELIPFVRHMKPGGGMCAQAVSFMAAALRRDVNAAVHGMPEITYIATKKSETNVDAISFDGLLTNEIADYFNSERNDRLAARWEASKLLFPIADSLSDPQASMVVDYEHALRCYILSHTPVIVPVDVGRMQGISLANVVNYYQTNLDNKQNRTELTDPLARFKQESIFKKNGLKDLKHSKEELRNLAHVVLIVGCTKESTGDNFAPEVHPETSRILFAFNDPAHFPFMTATAHDLVLAASYTSSESAVETLLFGWMLPVIPRPVEMPMLDESAGDRAGIVSISQMLKEISFKCPNGVEVRKIVRFGERKPEFRLIRNRRSEISRCVREILQIDDSRVEANFGEFLDHFSDAGDAPWSWLEIDHINIILWNAQTFVRKDKLVSIGELARDAKSDSAIETVREKAGDLAKSILVGVCVTNLKGAAIFCDPLRVPLSPKSDPTRLLGSLTASLLTSFEVVETWPELATGCQKETIELYMFMQSTAEAIFVKKPRSKWGLGGLLKKSKKHPPKTVEALTHNSALFWMAQHHADEYLQRELALSLLESHPKIIAVATYLPSLCAGERGPDTQINPALLALKFVLQVLKEMKKESAEKAPKILELVGGSRLLARVDKNPQTGTYCVRCVEEGLAIENILQCVECLLPLIEDADVQLAFEFEPSSIMALGSISALDLLVAGIEKRRSDDRRWERIGLNLDIAHFAFIARRQPTSVSQKVLGAVKHAHISLHSSGHFADGILEDNEASRKGKALEWLGTLESLKCKNGFDGFVSLELECAKNRNQVEISLECLKQWLSHGNL